MILLMLRNENVAKSASELSSLKETEDLINFQGIWQVIMIFGW